MRSRGRSAKEPGYQGRIGNELGKSWERNQSWERSLRMGEESRDWNWELLGIGNMGREDVGKGPGKCRLKVGRKTDLMRSRKE